jgi:hypothetical protein
MVGGVSSSGADVSSCISVRKFPYSTFSILVTSVHGPNTGMPAQLLPQDATCSLPVDKSSRHTGKEEQNRNILNDSSPNLKNTELRDLSPGANYDDRATSACRWSYCQLLQTVYYSSLADSGHGVCLFARNILADCEVFRETQFAHHCVVWVGQHLRAESPVYPHLRHNTPSYLKAGAQEKSRKYVTLLPRILPLQSAVQSQGDVTSCLKPFLHCAWAAENHWPSNLGSSPVPTGVWRPVCPGRSLQTIRRKIPLPASG